MLRARIAEIETQLIGCDTMHHADKFRLFPCKTDPATFTMTVKRTDRITPPSFQPTGSHKRMLWGMTDSGSMVLYNTSGSFLLSYNETFSDNTLVLKNGISKVDVLHYLYTAQCFSYHLLSGGGCTLHASGLKFGENGIALCGEHATGKSTLTRYLTAVGGRVLCEDAPAVLFGDELMLHGTPFCGDDEGCACEQAPLRVIVCLKRGTTNRLTECPESKKLFDVVGVLPRPVYARSLSETALDRAEELIARVPVLRFEHDATPAAADALRTALAAEGLL